MENEKDVPMIPQHQAEKMMMHMSWANRNMLIAIIAVCAAMVAMVIIFVNGYTARTKDWLNTLANLQAGKPAVTEVADGRVQQQPAP